MHASWCGPTLVLNLRHRNANFAIASDIVGTGYFLSTDDPHGHGISTRHALFTFVWADSVFPPCNMYDQWTSFCRSRPMPECVLWAWFLWWVFDVFLLSKLSRPCLFGTRLSLWTCVHHYTSRRLELRWGSCRQFLEEIVSGSSNV